MVRHALASEDKQVRRDVILEAARLLFVAGDGGLPAVARIASEAGLAKGTVYLYFRTKEEIFAGLLLAGWGALLDEVAAGVVAAGGRRADRVAALLAAYVGHLERHPELLRLDTLGPGVLERNLDAAKLSEFKLALMDRLRVVGAVIDEALRLEGGRGLILLLRTYALTRGLWQSSRGYEDEAPAELDSALAPLRMDFGREVREALTEYWRGALVSGHEEL